MATKQKRKQPKQPAKPRAKAAKPPRPKQAAKPKPKAAATATTPASATLSSPPPSSALSRSFPPLSGASPIDSGIRYLTVQDVVDLHRAVSTEFGGTQAHPGVVDSQFGLLNAVQRPQVTTLGREAFLTFSDKVAAFVFPLLQPRPSRGGHRRAALASTF